MSANTKIEWADHTFNPWIGCTKVGPGCDNCYAAAWDRRFAVSGHAMHWGAGKSRQRTKTWGNPVKWNKQHEAFFAEHGRRQRVFCASLADVFDNEVPTEWRMDLFKLIADTPNLDWLILTKRIGNVMPMCSGDSLMFDMICERVWLGATICNQEEANRDIPKLLAVPAAKIFLSMEPLLGSVNLRHLNEDRETNEVDCLKPYTWGEEIEQWKDSGEGWEESFEDHYGVSLSGLNPAKAMHSTVDWVIVGGESGPKARPMHPDWARSLRDQCEAAGVPFLFKQWGEWTPGENVERVRGTVDTAFLCSDGWHIYPLNLATDGGHVDDQPDLYQVGKKAAGRHLDGRTWDEVPT